MAVLAIASGLYVLLNIGLMMLSNWAESSQRGHPFRAQDWLRYHLTSYLGQANRDDVLLVGASAVRENILVHGIDPEEPGGRVFQGAFSLGTLEDTVLGLEFLERVHGAAHVPSTIILGVTSRSVAGINDGQSPFQFSLQRYSSHFTTRLEGGEAHLVEKTMLQSWLGRVRFFFVQRTRYRTAAYAAMAYLLGEPYDSAALFAKMGDLKAMFRVTDFGGDEREGLLSAVRTLGFLNCAILWMELNSSPYKYHNLEPLSLDRINYFVTDPGGLWGRAHLWDPATNQDSISRLLERLRNFVERNDVMMVVVNLPEHPLSAEQYQSDRYDQYLEILDQGLGDTPFLDLQTLLSSEEFYDVIHTTPAGAIKLTEAVNRFLQAQRSRKPK